MKQLNCLVTKKLHRRFKLACVLAGLQMSDVLRGLVEEWVEEQEAKEEGGDG